jgi:tricorn protease
MRLYIWVFLGCSLPLWACASEGYYREPSLRGDTLVFVAEGDLWTVAGSGGAARRLTTHPAQEGQPVLSPDGRQVAFVASYDGANEVYLMPLAGGLPRQLSFDGGRVSLQGFAPGGEIVYSTDSVVGPSGYRVLRLLDPASGKSRDLPLADANQASFDDAGKRVWFTRFGLHVSTDNALDYRGGAMAQLYVFNLGQSAEARRVAADWNANVSRPMWWQNRVHVLADASGRPNLWSLSEDGSERRALTQHRDFDVRSPSLDAGRIVYQHGADLRLVDIASGSDRVIPITLVSDFEQRQPRWIKAPLDFVEKLRIAPAGNAVAIGARGRVTLASTGKRRRVDLGGPADGRLREAALSADGKQVLAILDHAGLSEIWSWPSDGSGPGKRLVADESVHRWRLYPSPDGRWLAHDDKQGRLWLLDLEKGNNRLLERATFGRDDPYSHVAWSADSRYLALSRPDTGQLRNQIVLVDIAGKRIQTLTSDRYESFAPSFSPDGQWLYFLSNRNFQPTPGAPWGDRNTGPMFDRRARIYALALQPGLRFPFAPRDELSPPKDGGAAESAVVGPDLSGRSSSGDKKKSAKTLPAIDVDGLAQRLFEVPVPAANYEALALHAERLYLLDRDSAPDAKARLSVLAIDAEAPKLEMLSDNVREFALSADRSRLLLVKDKAGGGVGEIYLLDAVAKLPEKLDSAQVRVGDWAIEIDPMAEWRQMFADAGRMHQQFSFDPAMRGQDWAAVRQRFAALLPRVADRADLDDLLAQMSAEHGILHSQVRGGDLRKDADAPVPAGLGARLEADGQGVRIAQIHRTDPELPGERAPLQQSGVDAREGDLIEAINGRAIRNHGDVAAALRQQAGQQVLLTLKRGGAPAHRTVVVPVTADREAQLRYSEWVQSRYQTVVDAAGGRIGYLHLRAMGAGDMASFVRDFYAQIDRDGLIVDVRRNRGGNIDSWIIDRLMRRAWAFWQPPETTPFWNQQQSFRGHLVVLADQFTYSDGETFTAGVKALNLGPVIGMRTAGAGIWLSDRNQLLDKGIARVAEFGQFDARGRWLIEGNGVAPDIEVDNLPFATANGGDAQLQAALDYLTKKLAEAPLSQPEAQPIPARATPGHDGSR